ncbi:GspH/FimT family pseudopilin [Ectothiorhodospira variabilis]|uniref:GspH/FimT family pseudopilin n=1 Tax=Ectothiorhodospira variabilis TaxID=505694 RepID=UPI001EFAACBD|nr:GspH/FimT family pseudopilin [Ectothiorhodospira variabilis]MCG5496885.1 GspH/FimT family pseudopilin [Ectothiorhodospira variabilis]
MRQTSGLTLVELMVTISVFAILLAIAVPGFQTLVQNTRATTAANELVTALHYARSEAVRRGGNVSVCPLDSDWADGWSVRVGTCNGSSDPLRIWDRLPARVTIDSPSDSPMFGALGQNAGGGTIQFTYIAVQGCTGERARALQIGPAGHVGVQRVECKDG